MFKGFNKFGIAVSLPDGSTGYIETKSWISEDGELRIQEERTGRRGYYELYPNKVEGFNKFYNLFSSPMGKKDFILKKVEEYYGREF